MNISQPKKVQASQGWQWINQGTRYFLAYKSQWLLTLMVMLTVTMSLYVLSPIFQLVLVVFFPLVTAGLSMACADIEQGQQMSVAYLIKAKDNTNKFNIFRYGLLVVVMLIIAQLFSSVLLSILGVSNEAVNQAITVLKDSEEINLSIIIASPILSKFVVVNVLFLLPIIAVNQIAPVLMTFSTISGLDALKLSFSAVFKNTSAFLVYAAVFVGLILAIVFVLKLFVVLLLMIFGENSKIALLIYVGLFMVCMLSLVSLSYCSAYVSFKELFTEES